MTLFNQVSQDVLFALTFMLALSTIFSQKPPPLV